MRLATSPSARSTGIHWSAHAMTCCVPSRPAMPPTIGGWGVCSGFGSAHAASKSNQRPWNSASSSHHRTLQGGDALRQGLVPSWPRDVGAVVGQLLDVPAHAHAEVEPSAGEEVEGGHGLGQREQVVLERQRHPCADPQGRGGLGGREQAEERVHHPPVGGRQVATGRVGRPARGRDVGVLADPERGEPAVLQGAAELGGGHVLGRVHRREAELHRSSSDAGRQVWPTSVGPPPEWAWGVHRPY